MAVGVVGVGVGVVVVGVVGTGVVVVGVVTIAGLVWTHTDTFKQRTALHTERTHLEH